MDSTKTDIFAMDNSTTTTPRADTESTPMRDFLLGRSERMATMQTQKQQQKAEWEMITKANGFGQTKVENNRDDKNLRKNYLQSLDYNDQKTFIDLYNKNKDLSFGDVVKKLEDTSETARGGGYRAQINAQNERDAIDYANAIGLGTENLDNRVNENVQGYSTDSRKQALREKVDNLPIEQQMEYVNKYNNDETMQYLYKNAYEMALHQNASLLDNMLDTWEEEDVGPNFGVMMANIPQSTLKLFTASLRGVTNPADTLVGLGKLFATEEGRQALAERYGGWDAIKKTMEEDPVGLASDIMSITGNIAKAGGGATRIVGKATKNPLTSQIGKGIYKVGDAIDDASDFGTSKTTSEFLSNKAKELQASTSRISRGAGKYLELTQHPLQSIRKGGSKFLRGGFNADNSASNPESFVGRMKERIGNNFNPSGFTREERTRMQNNPYFQEEYNRAKSMVENSGMPVDPQRITEEGFQKIGDELKQKIETYENNLNANGKLYENLRNNPTRYNLTDGLNAIKQFFRENGITIVGDDLIFKHGTKEENAKIKEAWDMIQKNALNQTDFKNYHRVRQDIDNMAKYTEGPAVKKYQSVRKMRELLDDVAKREIPGLKKVDEVYKREIDELNKIKEGLVYKDNKKIGEWRDNFYSIMRTLNKQNRQTMKGRLEEQIFPGIAERVEAVDLASKAMKAYQDSPALMKVFGKMLGVSTGGLTAGLSVILGAILDEAVFKPLGEKMRKKALDQIASEMSPEAQQKLVDIEAKLKMGIELKEADKLVLDEARKEIEEAVKQFNDEEKQAKIKQEEKRKQVEAQRKEQEVQEAKQKEEFDSFLNDMEKKAPKIEKEEVNYKDLSDETLNELRDDETLPQTERDIIEKELFSRAQFDEATYDAEHERTPVYNMTRTDYIRKIKKLQEEEQRIGKVGKNTVNKDYADKQRKTRETKKERIIEMLGEDYNLDQHQAYDKFLELENAGVEEEGYSQRGGTKNRDKTKEQPILDQLSKKREIRNKQPAFLKSFKQDALDNREFYHTLLDGYEIQPVDKGDRIVKDGETVGNITYKENGTIDSVIVKDLDNFINQKKILQDLPADTMIKTAGDKYGMTAGEMREQLGIKEPKYQRAYHGGPNSFDRFDLSHMGEGEGAQAHGRGHYVALSEDVARGYAEKGNTSRNFYEVEIPDEKKTNTPTGTNYLDERKEFTREEKQKMYEALSKYPELESQDYYKAIAEDNLAIDPAGLYETMKRDVGAKRTSEILHEIGYDGIKYDGGQDGPCAVIFTDEAMQITRHEQYQEAGRAKQYEKDIKAQEGLSMENFKNGRTVEQIAKDYGIETNIVDRIATPEGEKALGMYADGLITLAKDIKESTAPHELLHATFDMVDAKRKQKILDTVKKKLEREGKTDDPEEWLADNFSEYFRTGKFEERGRPTGIKNKIVEFFKRVKDFITGIYKEKKTIRNLFDDIIDNKATNDMLNYLENKKRGGTGDKNSRLLYSRATSPNPIVHINSSNSSLFQSQLDQLKTDISNGTVTNADFLDKLRDIIKQRNGDSEYAIIENQNGSFGLRISDHKASAYNFRMIMNHPDNNLSIVLKDKNNDYRADGTRDYFKKYNGAEAIEHWYDSPKLTKDQKIRLIESLQQYIKDGTFNNEDSYDSITSVRKYQLAPMQKSLFDDDLIQEQPKTTKDIKKESEEWLKKTREEDEDGNMGGYLNQISTDKDFYIKDRHYKEKGAEIHQHLMDFFNSHTLEEIKKYVNKKDSGFDRSEADMILETKKYLDGDNLTVNNKLKDASSPLRAFGGFKKLYGGTKENARRNHLIETENSIDLLKQIDRIKDVYKHAQAKGVEIGHRFDKRKEPIERLIENEKINLEKEKEMKPYFDKIDDSFKHLGDYYLSHLKGIMEHYNGDAFDWKFELKKNGYTAEEIKKMHLDDLTDYIRDFFKDKDLNDYSDVMTDTEKKFIQRVIDKDFAPDVDTEQEINNIFTKYENTMASIRDKLLRYHSSTKTEEVNEIRRNLFDIIGKTYDPDVQKWQDNIYEEMKQYGEKTLQKNNGEFRKSHIDTVDTQDLTSLKSMFKELKNYEKYNDRILGEKIEGDSKTYTPQGIYQDYLRTKDPNIQNKETVQQLVALSNMDENKLAHIVKDKGKIPMPSIAVMNPDIHHVDFGPIQFVFGKDTVDPKANKKNVIYGTDAYTPTVGSLSNSIITKNGGAFIKGKEFKDGQDRPVTPENLLKAMQEGQPEAIHNVIPGSYKDMIQIIGSKIDDLEDVRKKNFADFRFHEIEYQIKELNEKYDEQVSNLEEEWDYRGKNIRKDIKKAYDPDAKKFAENLNQNENAYGTVSEETAQGLIDTIEKGRQSSIRYSESKPQRMIDAYKEVQYILVPSFMKDKVQEIVKGTPLENKVETYNTIGDEDRQDSARTNALHDIQKKYGNVFFSLGGIIMPIAYLWQMMNGGDEQEGQEA